MATDGSMQREFVDRNEMIAYLQEQFPETVQRDHHVSDTVGGRKVAEQHLSKVEPKQYKKTRNHLNGDVSYLSPYIRHGVLSLAEVRDAVLESVDDPKQAEKFINELGWRDYFQRKYDEIGDEIWEDQEEYKTGFVPSQYADELPEDIQTGETGLVCIDAFSKQLKETGYLHNHARMWMAGYVVHWRRVKWQAGAKWFLTHLLDGDPASNNLSWQWVASTFSHKPYFFNRDNLEEFTDGNYCQECPLYGQCDFEGDYADRERELFPNKQDFKSIDMLNAMIE